MDAWRGKTLHFVCLLGPSVGYNQEVVLGKSFHDGRITWTLPEKDGSHPAETLLHDWFGMKLEAKELLDLSSLRWASGQNRDLQACLHVVRLSKARFALLMQGFEARGDVPVGPTIQTFREITDPKRHECDWLTIAMVMYAWLHTEK